MKNLRKYSREKYNEVMQDYKNSFLSNRMLSKMHDIPLGTISQWTACVKRNFNKPCFATGKIIESLISGDECFLTGEQETKQAIERYLGKNENNFAGLKSKV